MAKSVDCENFRTVTPNRQATQRCRRGMGEISLRRSHEGNQHFLHPLPIQLADYWHPLSCQNHAFLAWCSAVRRGYGFETAIWTTLRVDQLARKQQLDCGIALVRGRTCRSTGMGRLGSHLWLQMAGRGSSLYSHRPCSGTPVRRNLHQ